MRKIFLPALLTVAALLTVQSLSAQFFIKPRVGYALSVAGEVRGLEVNGSTFTNVYGTTGEGFNAGLGLGYMFNQNIGIEADFIYFNSSDEVINNTPNLEQTRYSRQLRVAPAIVVTASGEGVVPYARFGVLIPVSGTTYDDVITTDEPGSFEVQTPVGPVTLPGTTDATAELETRGEITVGFVSNLGISYGISEKAALFTELELTTLSIRGRETEVVSYNGTATIQTPLGAVEEDIELSDLPEDRRLREYDDDSNDPDLLRPVSNFNSLGINIGVRFSF